MMKFSLLAVTLCSLLGLSQTGSKNEGEKRILNETEQQEIGKLIGKYYKAREQETKESEVVEKLTQQIESIQKKKKIDSLLKHVQEWEPILDIADDYSKGLSNGVETMQEIVFDETTKLKYLVSTPKKYSNKTSWPLLLIIPDAADENLKDHLAKQWAFEAIKESYIICIPQMPADSKVWTEREGFRAVLAPFSKLTRLVHLNCNRVFIAGVGNGAKAAAMIAACFPSRFAGLICRGATIGTPVAENFQSLPTLFTKKGEEVENFAKRIETLGYANTTVSEEDSLEKIAAWATTQHRINYPQSVVFRPPKTESRTAYWLKVERWETTEGLAPEQQPIIKATVDREKNQITVTANGVYSFWISINDLLVDMDKPVTVVTNNKSYVSTFPRSLQNLLEGIYRRNDNRIVFTATQFIEAPAVAPSSGAK